MTLPSGIHYGYPSADYFADPCPHPSLTQSVVKILTDKTPAHAFLAHPRLNPEYEHDEDTKFSVGNAAHALLLGRGKNIEIVDADDWRTKAAKEHRDEIHAAGKVAILPQQHEAATEIVAAVTRQLASIPEAAGVFTDAPRCSEVVAISEEPGGLYLRTMIDRLHHQTSIWDLKTTAKSVAPHTLPHVMADAGWDIQAAMQERILDTIDPTYAGRRHHYFIAIEAARPYALSVVEMTEQVMTIGRQKVERAVGIWRACMASGVWPAYPQAVQRPSYPSYAESKWMERMAQEGEEK